MKVKATKKGFDGIRLRKVGEVFDIKDSYEKDGTTFTVFDAAWMQKVDDKGEAIEEAKAKATAPVVEHERGTPEKAVPEKAALEPEPALKPRLGRPPGS